jgi:muramoyltetrapeptide carboxypeptidase
LRPGRLRPGDTVGVVAPAGPFAEEDLRAGKAIWEAAGFPVHVPNNLQEPIEYLAGPDWHRAGLIHAALGDSHIKALVAARGGYGALRLLDHLDLDLFSAHPKVLVGFSDLTVLQLELWRRFNLVTFSGPMIAGTQLAKLDEATRAAYFATLMETTPPPPLAGLDTRPLLFGVAEGTLLGGNLTLLVHMAAAGRLPSLSGAILLIEDVNEPPYRLDRMLTALRLGGHLDGVRGIAAGMFGEAIEDVIVDTILMDRLGDLGVPIVVGLDIGHGARNRLVPIGVQVRLSTAPPAVTFLESGVC